MWRIWSSIVRATTLILDYDIVAFARGKGFYGGVVLDGGYIGPDKTYNKAYYGREITAGQILFADTSDNGRAATLHAALSAE